MQIENLESMVKISLTDSERKKISSQVETLNESFKALENINTDGVEILFTVLDEKNILREDIVQKNISRETLLSTAPEQYGGYFQVPKTVEEAK